MENYELEKKLVISERNYTEMTQSMELKFSEQMSKV
jgi:hypothetical protein